MQRKALSNGKNSKINENNYIKNHISNPQNTHKTELVFSITAFLLRLADIYSIYIPVIAKKADEEKNNNKIKVSKKSLLDLHKAEKLKQTLSESNIKRYISELNIRIKNQNDKKLSTAWENFTKKCKLPISEYDIASTYQNGSIQKYLITNEMTIAMVYAALIDTTKYHTYPELVKKDRLYYIEKDKSDRLLTLFSCIKELETKPNVCPTGRRHDFAFTLNFVYPNVLGKMHLQDNKYTIFIEDMASYLADLSREHITHILHDILIENKQLYKKIWLSEFDFTQEKDEILFQKIEESTDKLRKIINNNCLEHGIDFNYFSVHIENHLAALNDLTLPLNNNATLHALKSILEAKASAGIAGKAIKIVKDWIHHTFEFDNLENEKQLQSFALIYENYLLLEKYEILLQNWKHELINVDQLKEIKDNFISYYENVIDNLKPIIHSTKLDNQIESLKINLNTLKNDSQIDWIENFFANYILLNNPLNGFNNSHSHQLLYTQLFDATMQEKIVLNDYLLSALFSENKKTVELSPYEINRIFLHAIILPPEKWTHLFAYYFSEVYRYVKNNFENEKNKALVDNLLKSSYSPALLRQLNDLINYYNKQNIHENSKNHFIPMPHFVKNTDYMCDVLSMFTHEKRLQYIYSLSKEKLKIIITIPAELIYIFIRFNLIENSLDILQHIGKETIIKILDDNQFNDSAKNFRKLLQTVKCAHEIQLINFVGLEYIKKITNSIGSLLKLIKNLYIENRLSFLKILGVDFISDLIIHSHDKLLNLCEFITFLTIEFGPTSEEALLHYLAVNHLFQKTIKSFPELHFIINKLQPRNHIDFFNLITNHLSSEQIIDFISQGLTRPLNSLIKFSAKINETVYLLAEKFFKQQGYQEGLSLCTLLNKLNEKKRIIFIKILHNNHFPTGKKSTLLIRTNITLSQLNINVLITDYWVLLKILGMLPIPDRFSCLQLFSQNTLISFFQEENIPLSFNYGKFLSILYLISSESRYHFTLLLTSLANNSLINALENPYQLLKLMNLFHEKHRIEYLERNLENNYDFLKFHYKNHKFSLLNDLREEYSHKIQATKKNDCEENLGENKYLLSYNIYINLLYFEGIKDALEIFNLAQILEFAKSVTDKMILMYLLFTKINNNQVIHDLIANTLNFESTDSAKSYFQRQLIDHINYLDQYSHDTCYLTYLTIRSGIFDAAKRLDIHNHYKDEDINEIYNNLFNKHTLPSHLHYFLQYQQGSRLKENIFDSQTEQTFRQTGHTYFPSSLNAYSNIPIDNTHTNHTLGITSNYTPGFFLPYDIVAFRTQDHDSENNTSKKNRITK